MPRWVIELMQRLIGFSQLRRNEEERPGPGQDRAECLELGQGGWQRRETRRTGGLGEDRIQPFNKTVSGRNGASECAQLQGGLYGRRCERSVIARRILQTLTLRD